jgi:hypothetical protein
MAVGLSVRFEGCCTTRATSLEPDEEHKLQVLKDKFLKNKFALSKTELNYYGLLHFHYIKNFGM